MPIRYRSGGMEARRQRRDCVVLPNHPHHIVQRSRFRSYGFRDDEDYQVCLSSLQEARDAFDLRIYGYCLMNNHIHLIVNPGSTARVIPIFMQYLAKRNKFDRCVFKDYIRAAWDEYKCLPIESDIQLFNCARYVDLNPVRAGLVDSPEDYPWSGYRGRAGLIRHPWLDDDPACFLLSETGYQRQQRYRRFVEEELPRHRLQMLSDELKKIRYSKAPH